MSYLTYQNMIDRFGDRRLAEVTTREGVVGEIDAAVLQVAIDDAVAEVESYVSGLYDTANPPRALTVHAAAIAWYRLLGDRAPVVEGAKDNYELALAFLRRAREGKVSLGDETPTDTAAGKSQAPQTSAPSATFSRDTLAGF
jgi:phage gp36-like protein